MIDCAVKNDANRAMLPNILRESVPSISDEKRFYDQRLNEMIYVYTVQVKGYEAEAKGEGGMDVLRLRNCSLI